MYSVGLSGAGFLIIWTRCSRGITCVGCMYPPFVVAFLLLLGLSGWGCQSGWLFVSNGCDYNTCFVRAVPMEQIYFSKALVLAKSAQEYVICSDVGGALVWTTPGHKVYWFWGSLRGVLRQAQYCHCLFLIWCHLVRTTNCSAVSLLIFKVWGYLGEVKLWTDASFHQAWGCLIREMGHAETTAACLGYVAHWKIVRKSTVWTKKRSLVWKKLQ